MAAGHVSENDLYHQYITWERRAKTLYVWCDRERGWLLSEISVILMFAFNEPWANTWQL